MLSASRYSERLTRNVLLERVTRSVLLGACVAELEVSTWGASLHGDAQRQRKLRVHIRVHIAVVEPVAAAAAVERSGRRAGGRGRSEAAAFAVPEQR